MADTNMNKMLILRKFPVQFLRSLDVSISCIVSGFKQSEMNGLVIDGNKSTPFLAYFMPTYAFITRGIGSYPRNVHHILRFRRFSKIAPSIIIGIFINMVYLIRRPRACNHSPYDPMRANIGSPYPYVDPTFFLKIDRTGQIPYFRSSGERYFPSQFPGFRVIRKQLSQFFRGWLSHRNSPGWRNRLARQASGDFLGFPDAALSILSTG